MSNAPHPNTYKFFELLRKEENKLKTLILQLEVGQDVNLPRKRKYIEAERKLDNLKTRLANEDINLSVYCRAVSYILGHSCLEIFTFITLMNRICKDRFLCLCFNALNVKVLFLQFLLFDTYFIDSG